VSSGFNAVHRPYYDLHQGLPPVKASTFGILFAVVAWLLATVAASMSERQIPLLEKYGPRTVYTDIGPAVATTWLDENRTSFSCLFLNSDNLHRCGFDIQVGDGTEHGLDLSHYTTLRLAVEYRGPAEQLRVSFRHFLPQATTAKYHEFFLPIREGNYVYHIPLNSLHVASWWINTQATPSEEIVKPDRSNVVHIGFDIENPMPIGQHFFKVNSYSAVSPLLSISQFGPWLAASCAYFGLIALIYYFMNLRFKLNQRSREMFGLLRKLERADSESAHFKRLSMSDPLTGLLNRRAALNLVDEYGSHNSLSGTGLIVIDLDHFKTINDTFGHDVGDEVLRGISRCIQISIRDSDAAVRWGGEELVVICPNTGLADTVTVAEKLRLEIEKLRFLGSKVQLSASFGVAMIMPQETFDAAFHRADEALYKAKQDGRNRVCRADDKR